MSFGGTCVRPSAALGLGLQSKWGVRRVRRRAERLEADPSNLIRFMPAEGAEMHLPKPTPLTSDLPDIAADILVRLRTRGTRVHCITNAVAQNFTANVLLAAGAVRALPMHACAGA